MGRLGAAPPPGPALGQSSLTGKVAPGASAPGPPEEVSGDGGLGCPEPAARGSRGVSGGRKPRAAPKLTRCQGSPPPLQRVGSGGRSPVVFRFQQRHWPFEVKSALIYCFP